MFGKLNGLAGRKVANNCHDADAAIGRLDDSF
jgi:hypothetical protein